MTMQKLPVHKVRNPICTFPAPPLVILYHLLAFTFPNPPCRWCYLWMDKYFASHNPTLGPFLWSGDNFSRQPLLSLLFLLLFLLLCWGWLSHTIYLESIKVKLRLLQCPFKSQLFWFNPFKSDPFWSLASTPTSTKLELGTTSVSACFHS